MLFFITTDFVGRLHQDKTDFISSYQTAIILTMPRPTKLTPELLARLKVVFLIGATYKEAGADVGISEKTISNYTKNNPELLHQIQAWRGAPILKAKQTIVDHLDEVKTAQWYLERRSPEFKSRQDITSNDRELPTPILALLNKPKN